MWILIVSLLLLTLVALIAGHIRNRRLQKKIENGELESKAGFKGLIRKGLVLVVILVACRMDMLLGVNYIRDAACIAFIVNELISMVENFGLMGVPFPEPIKEAIELLQKKGDGK